MSVCVVAQYPWKAVRSLIGPEPPGVIMCTDTRIADRTLRPFGNFLAKQIFLSPKLAVCYTSSHVEVTLKALDACMGVSNVKRLGRILKECHARFTGTTELLAVVMAKGVHNLQILEVMPPSYEPKPRTGIVGIGNLEVLQKFKESFIEDPSPDCPIEATPEMVEGLSKATGHPVSFGSRFPLGQAAARVTGELARVIEEVKSPTVALPVQATAITREGRSSYEAYTALNQPSLEWRRLTARHEELSLPLPSARLARIPKEDVGMRKAMQLFD